jgi:YfiH family protein
MSPPGWLSADWPAPSRVGAGVTTCELPGVSRPPFTPGNLGDRCGDDAADVARNRAILVEHLHLPAVPAWLRQVHGTDVHIASKLAVPAIPTVADASYTDEPGCVLAVLTADCLPVLVCDADGREIAAIHAGWRGLCAGVIEASLGKFRAPPDSLRVWLGPAIAAKSYEVGEEVRAAFLARSAVAEQAFTPTRHGHWLCDLYALARQRLQACGVASVHGGDFDTFTDPRFNSHRREKIGGRFASLIWIEETA